MNNKNVVLQLIEEFIRNNKAPFYILETARDCLTKLEENKAITENELYLITAILKGSEYYLDSNNKELIINFIENLLESGILYD